MNGKHIGRIITIIMIPLFVAGCFEYEERLVMQSDGSGSLEIEYWTIDGNDLTFDEHRIPKDEADIRKDVEERYTSKHVRLVDFAVRTHDNTRHVSFKVKFDDIDDLNDIRQFHDNEIKVVRSGRELEFRRTVFVDNDGDHSLNKDPDNILEAFILGLVRDGLSQIKFRFEVEVPGDIIETNADWTPGKHRAVWKYRLSDVIDRDEVEMRLKMKK